MATFQVGDWVRRKKDWADPYFGKRVLRITHTGTWLKFEGEQQEGVAERFQLVKRCPVPEAFDPHALGMANYLADLLVKANGKDWNKKQILYDFDGKRRPRVSRWLRACVTQELLSQAGAR